MADTILSRLVFQRFRSLAKEEVKFDNPTFLIGQNGCGKSNFSDAIAFLAEAMASPLQAVLEHRGGFAAVSHRGSARGRSNMGLAVELHDPGADMSEARYGIELRASTGSGFQVVREQCVVTRLNGSIASFDRRPVNGSVGWKSSVKSLDPIVEPNALALPLVGGDARFRPVFRLLSDMRVCRIEPAAVRALQDPDGGVRLQADGSNAASVLREIQRQSATDWERICELLQCVVPGTVGVQLKRHGNKLTLAFSQEWGKSAPVKFEAFNMSDGTLRVLGILAAIFQRPAPSLIVIEEPEATVHPGAIGTILDVLRHAGRFMQVVVTTHSPDVLDAQWIEDRHLRIASWERGITRVSTVSPSVRAVLREHLMGAGELLRSNAMAAATESESDKRRFELFVKAM